MLVCVYKNILGPWESRGEAGAALWLKRFQKGMPRAMFRNISPCSTNHYTSSPMALKVMSSYQLQWLRKLSSHIYARPQQKYNHGCLNSISPGPE